MNLEQEERIIKALEDIGNGLHRLADAHWKRYYAEYPPRQKPAPATVTRVKTDEDLLREEQGGTDEESLEDWLNINGIGKREREYIERERKLREARDGTGSGSGTS